MSQVFKPGSFPGLSGQLLICNSLVMKQNIFNPMVLALISGSLDQVGAATSTTPNCDKPGMSSLFWTETSNIDWATMAGDPTKFDPTNRMVKDYVMNAGAVFNELHFQRNSAYYDFVYGGENEEWNLLLSMIFKGKNFGRSNALENASKVCSITCHVFDYNGADTGRVIGVDWNGDNFVEYSDYLKVNRILDSSGQKGSSRARDEMDLTGISEYKPMFSDMLKTAIPV